jgi:hypothetical protein
MLVKKKEEIFKITDVLLTGTLNNSEKISKINEIISILSTIAGYAKADRDLSNFTRLAIQITSWLEMEMDASLLITIFCTAANSIKFDFTKRGLIISIPIQIKEAILNKIQLG